MASFDGTDLRAGVGSGGIFEVQSGKSGEGFHHVFPGGEDVIIPDAGTVIIARNLPAADYATTVDTAREAANMALDLSLARASAPLLLDHYRQPHIVWWRDAGRTTLRLVASAPFTIKMSAHVTVQDADGNEVVQSPSPQPTWHDSLRFYRVSEATGDLLDSFRNLYLAIEALLSDVCPPSVDSNGRLEREGDWLQRALRDTHQFVDLTPYSPASPRSPHNAIFDELYTDLRTAVFHAKRGRSVWLPQAWQDRSVIREARQRYAGLFRALVQHHLGMRFMGSGLSIYAFAGIADAIITPAEVFVSDDTTRVIDEKEGEYGLAPAGGRVTTLPTRRAHELEDDFTAGSLGEATGDDITRKVGGIRRFGTVLNGEPAIVESLAGFLDVSGVDIVEVALLVANRNHGAPRQDFDS